MSENKLEQSLVTPGDNVKDVELSKVHLHRKAERVMRNYHRKDDKSHNDLVSLELKLCDTVADATGDNCLNDRNDKRE